MFGDPVKPKNRRLTPKELEEDLILAKIFKRPLRTFINDTPTYPYLPVTPLANQPHVNFKLNFTE